MNVFDTKWECSICKKSGTLSHLIVMNKHLSSQVRQKIYHPENERKQIIRMFDKLIHKYGSDIEPLKVKVERLIQYYQEKKNTDE
ncbi:hypothetical protein DER53_03535 [Parageobacillus toebii NBRC 107807]|nr:hypothetical protein [Parageobacillus toebii]QIQ32041.1 hypothetical protein DER53_03535 [Parageobacillus toebii NBRC 107807]